MMMFIRNLFWKKKKNYAVPAGNQDQDQDWKKKKNHLPIILLSSLLLGLLALTTVNNYYGRTRTSTGTSNVDVDVNLSEWL